jgi:hypothetical protein
MRYKILFVMFIAVGFLAQHSTAQTPPPKDWWEYEYYQCDR